MAKPEIGSIGWIDLTVPDATNVKDFYCEVVGWESAAFPVSDYQDYCVGAKPSENPVAGICHALGQNSQLPQQWLIYIVVENVAQSVKKCIDNGGTVVCEPRPMGEGTVAVIRDPSGAACALYEA